MTLLGLDFDNTLVRYDKLFHQLALEKNLIEEIVPANKTAIRDYLREQGKEELFTLLQGEVYGPRILEAEPAEGMLEALYKLKDNGIQMVLVSHKTRTPYMGPAYDLHQAAWNWLEKYEFFADEGLRWERSQVYFEETKQKKVTRIETLKCSHYIDDLPEILEMIPEEIKRILYDPMDIYGKNKNLRIDSWEKAYQAVLGVND